MAAIGFIDVAYLTVPPRRSVESRSRQLICKALSVPETRSACTEFAVQIWLYCHFGPRDVRKAQGERMLHAKDLSSNNEPSRSASIGTTVQALASYRKS